MLLLDTHIWIWWVSEPERLSEQASIAIDKSIKSRSLCIATISTWEIAMLVKKSRLRLNTDISSWIHRTEDLSFVSFIPLNNQIALESVNLDLYKDLADRIIVATSNYLGAKLLTLDKKLIEFTGVSTIS